MRHLQATIVQRIVDGPLMSALGQKQTFKLLFDVIDWVPVREPKLRMAEGRAVG